VRRGSICFENVAVIILEKSSPSINFGERKKEAECSLPGRGREKESCREAILKLKKEVGDFQRYSTSEEKTALFFAWNKSVLPRLQGGGRSCPSSLKRVYPNENSKGNTLSLSRGSSVSSSEERKVERFRRRKAVKEKTPSLHGQNPSRQKRKRRSRAEEGRGGPRGVDCAKERPAQSGADGKKDPQGSGCRAKD